MLFVAGDTSFIPGARQAKGDIISTKEKGLAKLTPARAVARGKLDTQHSQAGLDTLVEGSHDNPRYVGNTHCKETHKVLMARGEVQ